MIQDPDTRTCSTCGIAQELGQFYGSSTECKPCKRLRSQENRATAAQKVALADRLIEVLERLADQGWMPDAPALGIRLLSRGPAGDATTPGPSTEPQEVRP